MSHREDPTKEACRPETGFSGLSGKPSRAKPLLRRQAPSRARPLSYMDKPFLAKQWADVDPDFRPDVYARWYAELAEQERFKR